MAKSVVAFSLAEFDPSYTRVLIGDADFRYTDFTNLGTLEVITGIAVFRNSQVEDLGNLTTIGGYADFDGSKVENLGNLTTIGRDAIFRNSQVENLGNLTTIGRDAIFRNSQVENLGNLTTIGQNADFYGNEKLKNLGNLTTIRGYANFIKSQVKNLGNLTIIYGDADFRNSQVKDLGNLTTIYGDALFVNSQVKDLGKLKTIKGFVSFDNQELADQWKKRSNKDNFKTGGQPLSKTPAPKKIDEKVGKEFWFEYHCFESPTSCDSEIWYRSHQKVKVLKVVHWSYDDKSERLEDGNPRVYLVEWEDGFQYDVFEDELMQSPNEFYRPDTPKRMKKGGRTIAQTPAPKKDRVYGSKKNKPESSKDTKSAEKIEFNEKTLETIKNKVAEHNEKNPKKKVTLASAKAVVRRGMGAYSSTHRPTISGGKPNSRVAWGLARLNAFFYKIINGKSKSGKYSQDDDLINELGYKVAKYSDGGDIQAYEEAMGISQFDEGGETKPKKVYVSIKLPNKMDYVSNEKGLWGGDRFSKYDDQPFQELKNHQLIGIRGVSLSPNNVGDWFSYKDCLVVMNYDEFFKLNDATKVKYDDPYQLMANDLKIFNRLYGNSEYTDEREKKTTRRENLKKIIEKIPFYFDKAKYEYYYDDAQKRDELQRYYYIVGNYGYKFVDWIIDNNYIINSPNDLTERLIEFAHLPNSESGIDNYRNFNLEKYVLSAEDIFPIVMKGLLKAGSTYTDEAEVIINNKLLNLPNKTQLFFKKEDFENSDLQDLIDKYELEKTYRVYSIKSQYIKEYQDKLLVSRTKRDIAKWELGKEQLEIKKELVLNDLQKLFFDKSLDKINKILDEKYPSTYYFDWEGDETKYFRWNEVIEVQFLLNKFFDITLRDWKSIFQTKKANEISSMSFYALYNSIEHFLRQFIEQNRDYLENINKYHNENGDYLWLYDIERAVLGVVSLTWDEENGISHDTLAKKYFQMIGGELTTYYKQDEIVMPSIYINGGKTDEPTEFWGTEAGGVLVYCSTTQRYLILLRSEWVLEPNTWGIISGKLDDEENVQEAVFREAEEEIGYKLRNLIPTYIFEKPKFKFHNFISIVDEEFIPELNWENTDYKWVKINEMPENLHFGLKLLLEKGDIPKLVANNVYVEKYSNGGLIAPNGKPSNLTPEQYKLVRTPAFKDWFGDWENDPANASKVVDENGEPKVMWHYSPNEFTIFNPSAESRWVNQRKENVLWFGGNEKVISYSEGEKGFLYQCFLNVKKPIIVDAKKYDEYDYYKDEQGNKNYSIQRIKGRFVSKLGSVSWDGKRNENDGVIFYNAWDNISLGVVVAVPNPNQIKLADGSNTTFDSNNPDIRFMAGGRTKKAKTDKSGNPIGDGNFHVDYFVEDMTEYPQVKISVSKSDSTESVYVRYFNEDNAESITLRFSMHENNAVKFGYQLNGYTASKNDILYELGLINRKFVPNTYLSITKRQVKKVDLPKYEESNLSIKEMYDLGEGADISMHKGKIAKGSNYLIQGDTVEKIIADTGRFEYFVNGGVPKKFKFDIEEDEDEDRTEISINGVGKVILTMTYPEYEFMDDIGEDGLEELGIEEGEIIGKIEHIEINDKYKGQGYAKLLMNKAIEIAEEKGLMPLYINASPMGSRGLNIDDLTAFYESFGFQVFLEQGNNNLMILK